jgi:hypothetical protein
VSLTLDTSEVRALAARTATAGLRIGAKASAVLRRTAYAIQADYQAGLVAMDAVDTGNLLNSASTEFRGDGRSTSMSAETGPTAEYGIYVELGTSVMPGRPALANAFDRRVEGYTLALGAVLADEVL